MKRRHIFAVVVIVTALLAGTWAVGQVQESTDNTYSNIERFIQVLTKVRDHYVEPVTSDKLMDAAIRGMLRTLDPYSQYLDKDEAQRLETTEEGLAEDHVWNRRRSRPCQRRPDPDRRSAPA